MQPSLDLRRLLLSFMTVAVLSCCAFGQAPPPTAVSDQKAGSILFYPFYSSSTTDPAADSRIATTNTSTTSAAFVHIFMVSGSSCNVADFFTCFTAAQTSYFLASVLDPGTSGYILMVAVDGITGCPVKFNFLIGDGFVKLSSGLHGNYGAESIAAIADPPDELCGEGALGATLAFDGVNYEQVPAVLALDNFPAIDDGYTTRIWVSRAGGDLFVSGSNVGTIFGVLYNDAETGLSFSLSAQTCQRAFTINDTDVRTAPRPSVHVPANSSGWVKFWSTSTSGIFAFAATAKAGLADVPNAFAGGRNLHKLRFTNSGYRMPVFPPTC